MKKNNKTLALTIAAISLIMVLSIISFAGGPGEKKKESNSEVLNVIVTIPPQYEFVKGVGGDLVNIEVLVPSGASPHSYEPTPSQLVKVSEADAYMMVGSGVEFELSWADKIIALNRDMAVVDCSNGIELLGGGDHDHDGESHDHDEASYGKDPHIWNSLRDVEIMVENIYSALVEIDPQNAGHYAQNKEDYVSKLRELDLRIIEKFSESKTKTIMVYHDAWAYFAKDYGLQTVAIEAQGKEPTPQGIAALIDQARGQGIKVIFASPEFSVDSAQTIASEIGGDVVLISPLKQNYLTNMNAVADSISSV
jgi:zinc transport system substrate-binding protein